MDLHVKADIIKSSSSFFFLKFLEISCNVWNIYINIFPYK